MIKHAIFGCGSHDLLYLRICRINLCCLCVCLRYNWVYKTRSGNWKVIRKPTGVLGIVTAFMISPPFFLEQALAQEEASRTLFTATRALRFVDSAGKQAVAAIIYNPSNQTSLNEAQALVSHYEERGGLQIDASLLQLELTSIQDVASARNARIAYVTQGLSGETHAALAESLAGAEVITITGDLACVENGHCVMGVRVIPRVEFYISETAARRAAVRFQAAFKILAKEL